MEDPKDEDWLFDTRRDYIEQLFRYKTPAELQRLEASIDARSKTCVICGAKFRSQRVSAKYCSPPCKQRGMTQASNRSKARARARKRAQKAAQQPQGPP